MGRGLNDAKGAATVGDQSGVGKNGRYDALTTSVLFELIGARYERRSVLVTANQPFGQWGEVFPDQATTLAAVDRLVHHAVILEMNVESYRRRAAEQTKRAGPGRPASRATGHDIEPD